MAFYIIYHEGNTEENNGYVVFTVDEIFTDQLGNRGGEGGSQRGLNNKRPTKSTLIKKIKKGNSDGIGCKVIYKKGLPILIYEELRKFSDIYEEAVSHTHI